MHDESLLDIAIAWTFLGIVVFSFALIKLGILTTSINNIPDLEPRVVSDRVYE